MTQLSTNRREEQIEEALEVVRSHSALLRRPGRNPLDLTDSEARAFVSEIVDAVEDVEDPLRDFAAQVFQTSEAFRQAYENDPNAVETTIARRELFLALQSWK